MRGIDYGGGGCRSGALGTDGAMLVVGVITPVCRRLCDGVCAIYGMGRDFLWAGRWSESGLACTVWQCTSPAFCRWMTNAGEAEVAFMAKRNGEALSLLQ